MSLPQTWYVSIPNPDLIIGKEHLFAGAARLIFKTNSKLLTEQKLQLLLLDSDSGKRFITEEHTVQNLQSFFPSGRLSGNLDDQSLDKNSTAKLLKYFWDISEAHQTSGVSTTNRTLSEDLKMPDDVELSPMKWRVLYSKRLSFVQSKAQELSRQKMTTDLPVASELDVAHYNSKLITQIEQKAKSTTNCDHLNKYRLTQIAQTHPQAIQVDCMLRQQTLEASDQWHSYAYDMLRFIVSGYSIKGIRKTDFNKNVSSREELIQCDSPNLPNSVLKWRCREFVRAQLKSDFNQIMELGISHMYRGSVQMRDFAIAKASRQTSTNRVYRHKDAVFAWFYGDVAEKTDSNSGWNKATFFKYNSDGWHAPSPCHPPPLC